MKYVYIVLGLGVAAFATFLSYMLLGDFSNIFTGYTNQVRAAGALLSWVYACILLYHGFRPGSISRLSNVALHIFWVSLVISQIFAMFAPQYVGSAYTPSEIFFDRLWRATILCGPIASLVIMIISLFRKNVRPQ